MFLKICIVLGLFSGLSVCLVSYAILQLGTVSAGYVSLIENEATASTALARSNTKRGHDSGKAALQRFAHGDHMGTMSQIESLETSSREVIECLDRLGNALAQRAA